ncbi:hypothetical protein [Kurthia sibirica]|uniref:Uncharacterized protein n=1 Tax=Kurthia sibirica TaxID=202750 RepID=A0A2U3APF6_9BACL|nr:hypothetical protein [Kurthia sibirica]PWI26335.1 hypothetical protein DEX24_03085 [Kurthia sibirica]GEK34834.1 hypothetical protein KSI01_23670 [Kurthia sibirica]
MVVKKVYTKAERITREERRLKRNYKDIQKDKSAVVEGLIRRAAFMRATLEDMEIDLDNGGFVEMFAQGDQEPYERERPVARQYQQMNKNYQSILKQLSDLLPKEPPKQKEDDGFDSFVMQCG